MGSMRRRASMRPPSIFEEKHRGIPAHGRTGLLSPSSSTQPSLNHFSESAILIIDKDLSNGQRLGSKGE